MNGMLPKYCSHARSQAHMSNARAATLAIPVSMHDSEAVAPKAAAALRKFSSELRPHLVLQTKTKLCPCSLSQAVLDVGL